MQKTITYFSVCITDGRNMDGTASIRESCEHLHRSEAAAERCKETLLNWNRARLISPAKWYNASILEVDRDGRHAPQPEMVTCCDCGKVERVELTLKGMCQTCAEVWCLAQMA